MRKFLALFDLHFGYERGYVNGKYVTRPTHNLPLVKAVNKFAQDFQPDILVLGGDQLNCGPISHWHKGKPRLDETLRLKEEYDLLIKNIFDPFANLAINEVVWLQGNHEMWLEDHIVSNPSLEGLVEFKQYLLKERPYWEKHIDWKDHGAIHKIGKLYFTHGDTIMKSGNYINPAQHVLSQTRVNIRFGHGHSYFAAADYNTIASKDIHTSIMVPACCNTEMFYMDKKPNKCLNGFLYGYILDNGNFTDNVVVAHNNKFIVNGVKYD